MDKDREPSCHLDHRKRLKNRFLQEGLDHFEPHEVLELLLYFAIPQGDTNPLAHRLLDRFGSLSGVLQATPEQLTEVKGVGEHAAVLLHLMPSLARVYRQDAQAKVKTFHNMAEMGNYAVNLYIGKTEEEVYMMLFDNAMHLIDCPPISVGAVNASQINIRHMVELAFNAHASCAVLLHNHPGGVAIPSGNDMAVTSEVDHALDLMGINLLEHLVVAGDRYMPLLIRQRGLMRAAPGGNTVNQSYYRAFYGDYNPGKETEER